MFPTLCSAALILFFGWFGFNAGSTLSGTDLRMSVIAVNTLLAGCTAATVVFYARLMTTGKSDAVAAANGASGRPGCNYCALCRCCTVGGSRHWTHSRLRADLGREVCGTHA